MRSLIIAFLLISINLFSQDEKRGTIKVKKKSVERYSSDTIYKSRLEFDSLSGNFLRAVQTTTSPRDTILKKSSKMKSSP
jgi:hypothetical protein